MDPSSMPHHDASSNAPKCPQCGEALAEASPGGLCPRCLIGGLAAIDREKDASTMSSERPDAIPKSSNPGAADTNPEADPLEGSKLGSYRLLQRIGEGGFGLVYMAEQIERVHRRVAIKIIKAGMDSKQVIARFEAERQALALMDHPNIARVLEIGETDQGRPYFVMELVKGVPITTYCQEHRLGIEERVDLFVQVCHAVQHAHVKGVIHRDLKPTNLLVTTQDGRAIPKIIDFGIAKAMDQRLTDKTLFTRFEQMIGTPAYMSPEQVASSAVDVDTRSDVYALGVLLYELLTGTPPFDATTLREAAAEEMRRIIREDEPPKPSTRLTSEKKLSTQGPAQASGSGSPNELTRVPHTQIARDLDWIVMKALEKDRARRYETARDLARDIERFRQDQPVEAGAPSLSYRARKFIRRNRVAVLTGSLVLVAIAVGSGLAVMGLLEARKERRVAQEAQAEAKREAAISGAVSDFLSQDLLAQANPYQTPGGQELTLKEVLDRAAAKLDERFGEQPEVRASLHFTLAETYQGIGASKTAEGHARQAAEQWETLHGFAHPTTSRGYSLLGQILTEIDQQQALEVQEKVLRGKREVLGPEAPSTLRTQARIASLIGSLGQSDQAEERLREVLMQQQKGLGEDHPDTTSTEQKLARHLFISEDPKKQEEAIQMARALVALLDACCEESHPRRLGARHQLATMLGLHGQNEEAAKLHREVLSMKTQVFGEDHPETVATLGNLGDTLLGLGAFEEAFSLLERTLQANQRHYGDAHPNTLTVINNLARGYLKAQHPEKAIPLFEQLVALGPQSWGEDHPHQLSSMSALASAYGLVGRNDEAVALSERTLETALNKWGPEHPRLLYFKDMHAWTLASCGRFEQSMAQFDEACQLAGRLLGDKHLETAVHLDRYADVLLRAYSKEATPATLERALEASRRVFQIRTEKLGKDHPATQAAQNTWLVSRKLSGETLSSEEEQLLFRFMNGNPKES